MLRAEPSSAKIETGLQLGRVLSENLKQPDRALAAYERVLELSPNNASALDRTGDSASRGGRRAKRDRRDRRLE